MKPNESFMEGLKSHLQKHGFEYLKSSDRFRRKTGKNTESLRLIPEGENLFSAQYFHWNQAVEELRHELFGHPLNEAQGWTVLSFSRDQRKIWKHSETHLLTNFIFYFDGTILPWFEEQSDLRKLSQTLETRDHWRDVFVIDALLNDTTLAEQHYAKFVDWLSTADLTQQSVNTEQYKKLHDTNPVLFPQLPSIQNSDDLVKAGEDEDFRVACATAFADGNSMMSEPYKVFVVLGSSPDCFWYWKHWQTIYPILDPLIAATRGKATVSTSQAKDRKAVKFGALGWNRESHEKWTYQSPKTHDDLNENLFLYMSVCAPSLPVCEKENLPPDLVIHFANEPPSPGNHPDFNSTIIVGVRESFAEENKAQIETAIRLISTTLQSKLTAVLRRPFAFRNGQYSRVIDLPFGAFRAGRAKAIYGPKLEALAGPWVRFD